MRRILHVGKFYPPHRGGMERVLEDLVSRQSTRYDVRALCSSDQTRTSIEFRDGAQIVRVGTFGTLASTPLSPGLIWNIRNYNPDLVHLHTPNPLGALAVLSAPLKCPIVIEHHSDTLGRPLLRRFVDPITNSLMKRADLIVATSERYAESSRELQPYASKVTVVPLGITLSAISSEQLIQSGEIRRKWGDRLIVAVGRLVPYKGFNVLLQAMSEVNGTLLLIGDGALRSSLFAKAHSLSLMHRVHILTRVSDVVPYLNAADVFVMPSLSRAEAFGLAQLEAMGCGTPVVNTNVDSAVPEVSVNGLTGLTVPPNNSAELASAINLLLNNPELRRKYGGAARHRAGQQYTADLMAQRIEQLYVRLGVHPTTPELPQDKIPNFATT